MLHAYGIAFTYQAAYVHIYGYIHPFIPCIRLHHTYVHACACAWDRTNIHHPFYLTVLSDSPAYINASRLALMYCGATSNPTHTSCTSSLTSPGMQVNHLVTPQVVSVECLRGFLQGCVLHTLVRRLNDPVSGQCTGGMEKLAAAACKVD